MSESARVSSIDALKDYKDALCVFRDEAVEALGAVEMEIRRAFDWVQEQTRFWQNELRRREEKVLQARSELERRKLQPTLGNNPDTYQEQKLLRLARQRVEEAEEKIEKCRQQALVLRRAVDEYEGPGRHLAFALEAEVPNAVALLERKLDALDAYTSLRAPPAAPPKTETPPAPATE